MGATGPGLPEHLRTHPAQVSEPRHGGMHQLPEYVDGLPNISGSESLIDEAMRGRGLEPVFWRDGAGDPFAGVDSACAIALHMHQPLIPAGGDDLRSARLISNLQYMEEHPEIGDNHNAPVFRWCYKRMGEFHPAADRRGPAAAGDARVLRHVAARPASDGRRRCAGGAAVDHLRPELSLGGGVAGLPVGTLRRSVDAGSGLSGSPGMIGGDDTRTRVFFLALRTASPVFRHDARSTPG